MTKKLIFASNNENKMKELINITRELKLGDEI